jgi:hypothetical protein
VAKQLDRANLGRTLCPRFQFNAMLDVDLKDLLDEAIATVRDIDDVMTFSGGSRTMTRHEYLIEVCLRTQVPSVCSEWLSRVKLTMQDVGEYFRFRALDDRPERFIRAENRRVMEDEAFKDRGVVKASITLVFQGWRN